MKARITKILLLLSVVVLSGCLSTDPNKAHRTISHWIPPGTPQEDAIRIMQTHRFTCAIEKWNERGTVLSCERETSFWAVTFWHVRVDCEDGKVVAINPPVIGSDYFDFLLRIDHKVN